jgi:hypothetical protein
MLRAIAGANASPPPIGPKVRLHQYLLKSDVFEIALTGGTVETDSSEILTRLNPISLLAKRISWRRNALWLFALV